MHGLGYLSTCLGQVGYGRERGNLPLRGEGFAGLSFPMQSVWHGFDSLSTYGAMRQQTSTSGRARRRADGAMRQCAYGGIGLCGYTHRRPGGAGV
jgi:hypothetical protein